MKHPFFGRGVATMDLCQLSRLFGDGGGVIFGRWLGAGAGCAERDAPAWAKAGKGRSSPDTRLAKTIRPSTLVMWSIGRLPICSFAGAIDGRPTCAHISSNSADRASSGSSTIARIGSQWMGRPDPRLGSHIIEKPLRPLIAPDASNVFAPTRRNHRLYIHRVT